MQKHEYILTNSVFVLNFYKISCISVGFLLNLTIPNGIIKGSIKGVILRLLRYYIFTEVN